MNKNFELWLDESGDFENQHELEGTTRKPSLIGGFLVEEEVADKIDFGGLIDSNRNHAMELEEDDKKNYVLPVLQKMKSEYNAAQVFFENQEYHDEATSRQLYLSMMAEGILQLLQRLNARYESVGLRVTIAQRQDVTAEAGNQRIRENEYKKALEYCIKRKQRERRAMLHPDCEVSFEICRASDSMRLQLADFACNTRLTRDSHAFKDVRSEVEALYSTAFLFTLTEMGSQNFIQQCLAQNNYSDAILELYTTKDNLEHGKILSLMAERMKNCSYRLIKSQMKNCVADLLVYALNEDDYEVGEALLKNLLDELIPFLKKNGMPQEHLHFSILLNLSDMYLREGDIYEAKLADPLPHLIIICDEFAELRQQNEEFLDQLVRIARIGRSLGVHMILATQKPDGVVSDQIRANIKFWICLKVQDKYDSKSVLDRPDAAAINAPGRFFMKVGANEVFVQGQSPFSGALYYPSEKAEKNKDDLRQ